MLKQWIQRRAQDDRGTLPAPAESAAALLPVDPVLAPDEAPSLLAPAAGDDAGLLKQLAAELYSGDDLSAKPAVYLDEYARWFGPRRHEPLRIFEIGVQRGVSMRLWERFFPNATVVGLDGDECPAGFPDSPRFHFVKAWQDDAAAMARAVALAGGAFDIIIDDASHLGCHTARSLALLFPHALKRGGIYVIEDICTAFNHPSDYDAAPYAPPPIGLPGMPKVFPSHEYGMVGLVKQLVDHAMGPTAIGRYTDFAIDRIIVKTNIALLFKASHQT